MNHLISFHLKKKDNKTVWKHKEPTLVAKNRGKKSYVNCVKPKNKNNLSKGDFSWEGGGTFPPNNYKPS